MNPGVASSRPEPGADPLTRGRATRDPGRGSPVAGRPYPTAGRTQHINRDFLGDEQLAILCASKVGSPS